MLHAVSISHTLPIERGVLLQLNIEKVVLSTEKNKLMLSMYSYIQKFCVRLDCTIEYQSYLFTIDTYKDLTDLIAHF